MNWIDFVLIALLLTAVIVGSKKGLVRELSAFVVTFAIVIVSVNNLDFLAIWVNDKLGLSALLSAFIAFTVLIGASYGAFKLLGVLFYKIASLKSNGRRDQVGGAIVGFVRGWMSVGILAMGLFLLPLPETFFATFDASVIGRAAARTVPVIYEGTRMMHPSNPDFIEKIRNTLQSAAATGNSSKREDLRLVLNRFDRFFASAPKI